MSVTRYPIRFVIEAILWQNREFPIEILGLVYTLPERSRITAANSIKDRIQLGTDKRAVLNKKSYPGQIMNQE